MEHPVPQNVTSFEFHLVGDMTLKQFGYLATGLTIAYFTFILIFPLAPLLAIPIIGVSASFGAALAFLPILDRPLDHWVKAFFKAVYSPTQGSWQSPFSPKEKIDSLNPVLKNRLQSYLNSLNTTPTPIRLGPTVPVLPLKRIVLAAPAQPQTAIAPSFAQQTQTQVQTPPKPQSLPSSSELNKLVEMAEHAQILKTNIAASEKQINDLRNQATHGLVPGEQVQKAATNLQNLVKQTEYLYHQTSEVKKFNPQPQKKSEVVIVEPFKQVKTQMMLTTFPNVINGVVTDIAGNYLEGVIVIIHDKNNLPVRALKTNKLGQFAGSTPLPAGVYTITLEKDNLDFETLQIDLKGEVMPPIMVSAKKGSST